MKPTKVLCLRTVNVKTSRGLEIVTKNTCFTPINVDFDAILASGKVSFDPSNPDNKPLLVVEFEPEPEVDAEPEIEPDADVDAEPEIEPDADVDQDNVNDDIAVKKKGRSKKQS